MRRLFCRCFPVTLHRRLTVSRPPLGRPGCGLLPLRRNKKPRTTAGLMWSLKLVFVA